MPELSPAARAVLAALHRSYDRRAITADVLEALANQVVPEGGCEAPDCCLSVAESVRRDILRIAAELRAHALPLTTTTPAGGEA